MTRKRSKCSKLVVKPSKLSQNVHFRRILVRTDLFLLSLTHHPSSSSLNFFYRTMGSIGYTIFNTNRALCVLTYNFMVIFRRCSSFTKPSSYLPLSFTKPSSDLPLCPSSIIRLFSIVLSAFIHPYRETSREKRLFRRPFRLSFYRRRPTFIVFAHFFICKKLEIGHFRTGIFSYQEILF